ncbi:hypothetical protein OVA24_16980 [Luteolibacter sp. SL250]|uniref:hypothetical protein n=1 Tax=Luteolibacter sp. SL250 TaxID=2995170 RepID=UPI0022708C71|nr:hypothetical protein [Luteolibacter sp. SL250]WAC18928.1 hypothetical protein OVA24_16980 [Luteolibacter sp. SL250]
MKPDERKEWIDRSLEEILQAVGSDVELKSALVFKGARIPHPASRIPHPASRILNPES